jgi:hypothetical protein
MGKPSDTQSPVKSSEWLYQPPGLTYTFYSCRYQP